LFWKKDITIEPFGMRNSIRQKKDGYTFFGSEKSSSEILKKASLLNDYILNYDIDDRNYDNIFYIYFKKEKQKYYIRPYNLEHTKDKYCLHLKLQKPYVSIANYVYNLK